jgi:Tol biopolymer transport system component
LNGGLSALMTVRTTGSAAPVLLKKSSGLGLPDWSPAGDWITLHADEGWSLISPDGKNTKSIGRINSDYLAFSRDGKLLYGIETGATQADRDHLLLFSLDVATLKRRDIKKLDSDLKPETNITPGVRLSLAPDGKSIAYTTAKFRSDLWMLQGYRQPGWFGGLSGMLK